MIKVKWVKAHPKYAYVAGDTGYVRADVVEELVSKGYVIPLPDEIKAPVVEVNPLPEDMPGREKLYAAGFKSADAIKLAGDSLLDAGISNAILKKITKYLKDVKV